MRSSPTSVLSPCATTSPTTQPTTSVRVCWRRTASGPGQHATVGLFLEAICRGTDAETAAQGCDILRNTHNQLRYGAKQIGTAESSFAIKTATALLAQARKVID